ncbi:uncharacterized protein LOC123505771 isoform X2 [Portunus trituberculatus]|uniref:uncharacterized protein LOC123505771 isoform X2 n=1 Tax=Portunus trituberculatus TaxID=210409 RepID=UPI001E1CB07A|nr:uncharacterized protein LOC123505771 isoform X2 [Portunus trituberculatus]
MNVGDLVSRITNEDQNSEPCDPLVVWVRVTKGGSDGSYGGDDGCCTVWKNAHLRQGPRALWSSKKSRCCWCAVLSGLDGCETLLDVCGHSEADRQAWDSAPASPCPALPPQACRRRALTNVPCENGYTWTYTLAFSLLEDAKESYFDVNFAPPLPPSQPWSLSVSLTFVDLRLNPVLSSFSLCSVGDVLSLPSQSEFPFSCVRQGEAATLPALSTLGLAVGASLSLPGIQSPLPPCLLLDTFSSSSVVQGAIVSAGTMNNVSDFTQPSIEIVFNSTWPLSEDFIPAPQLIATPAPKDHPPNSRPQTPAPYPQPSARTTPRSHAPKTSPVRWNEDSDAKRGCASSVSARKMSRGTSYRPKCFLKSVVGLLAVLAAATTAYELKPTTTVSRTVLAGRTARLPCELPRPPDRPTLVLWYKNPDTKPFYSLDARENAIGRDKVLEGSELGRRSRFRLETLPYSFKARVGFLEVKSITLEDAGNYTCRVDFLTSQTMMSLLRLTVHEDIQRLTVTNAYDVLLDKKAGPYELSARVMLTCRAYGGFPPAVVRWVSQGEVLESSITQPVSTPSGRHIENSVGVLLHLPGLKREDNGREVTCLASNTNLTKPHARTLTIDMYLPPLTVSVEGADQPLQVGLETALVCRTTGSKPPATLTWNITGSGNALTSLPQQSSLDGNTTVRRGRLSPTMDDNGQTLTCTASNPQVFHFTLVATHTLTVLFGPVVKVLLAPALDPTNIREGEDVYFECHIKANPPETRVVWLHEGEPLLSDRSRGVLAQGRNLVLQRVSRQAAGKYQCRVTNTLATVTSEPAALDVLYPPECSDDHEQAVSVAATEEVELRCVLEANPAQVEFKWSVNTSQGWKELEESSYTTRGSVSTLRHRPHEFDFEEDRFGVVVCQGSNTLGHLDNPCVFTVTAAGPPEEPTSCSLVKQSATSLGISCHPGHDGGLPQTFLATVRDAGSHEVVANASSPSASFTVGGLAPGRDYLVLVRAVNTQGISPPYLIHGFALKVAENKINDTGLVESSSLLVVFVGVVSGFILVLVVLAAATRSRCRRRGTSRDAATPDNKHRVEALSSPTSTASPAAPPPDTADEDDKDTVNRLEEVEPQMPSRSVSHTLLSRPTSALQGSAATPDPTSLQESAHLACSTHLSGPSPSIPLHSTEATSPRGSTSLRPQSQPLLSTDLPRVPGSSTHKYYTLKINTTRQSNESFV